jgi:hypothetical protein
LGWLLSHLFTRFNFKALCSLTSIVCTIKKVLSLPTPTPQYQPKHPLKNSKQVLSNYDLLSLFSLITIIHERKKKLLTSIREEASLSIQIQKT